MEKLNVHAKINAGQRLHIHAWQHDDKVVLLTLSMHAQRVIAVSCVCVCVCVCLMHPTLVRHFLLKGLFFGLEDVYRMILGT